MVDQHAAPHCWSSRDAVDDRGDESSNGMTLGKQRMRLLLSSCHRVGVVVYFGTDMREELRTEEISLATPPSEVNFTIRSGSYGLNRG